ncbi:RNA polymerase sigma-70 factor (ECF subfamily) [Micromonospora pisi]|uniref:RNA polymerase sigma-70 factor (ECF subfamily) n=1 Tax=Micromonospora pisi TaxID=589240 RepID=A0A495JUK9_9ACTN|nr:sigma-70 family RNA polymerase sigma factor [Micromonospora pisi]RKR92002.1 RNA polymerase sigma-70 factor (ECF subfamily) [Micromonospora pisi]
MISAEKSDAELVHVARSGDVAGLGALLHRHEAGMKAVAVSLLGYGPDAEDAVQDAMLVALRRIDGLREPAVVGDWLRSIVRNGCRNRLRASRRVVLRDFAALDLPAAAPNPEQLLEQASLRDWTWHAVNELSEPLRLVTLLRYFSGASSYEEIAALCGVPVGTVRSRLNQARRKLATALRDTADLAHEDSAALHDTCRRQFEEVLAAAGRGEFERAVREYWWPDADFIRPNGERRTERSYLVEAMERDLAAGVRQRITGAVASRDVMVWEAALIDPPDDPEHCPPAVVWLHSVRAGRTKRLRLFHAPRAAVAS